MQVSGANCLLRLAHRRSDRWYRSLGDNERRDLAAEHDAIAARWIALVEAGADPSDDPAQINARRHIAWLRTSGAPISGEYLRGLGQMYVDDARFGAHYAPAGADHRRYAEFVRDALATASK